MVSDKTTTQINPFGPDAFRLSNRHEKATFTALYSELALHQAVIKAYGKPFFSRRKGLATSHDGRTFYDFVRNAPRHIARLHAELSAERFQFRAGVELNYNFNGKHRTIYLFPWEERIVDVMLYQLLSRHFHGAFSRHSYAYRHRGFGLDLCQHRVARQLRTNSFPIYFFKRDVADYFPTIDHHLLLKALAEWVAPDDYLYELLRQRIEFLIHDHPAPRRATRGIPFGSAVACFFANLYLTPVDRAMEQYPGLHYFRYADDVLAFSRDLETLRQARTRFESSIARLGLRLKANATADFAFGAREPGPRDCVPATKFRHLGLEFRSNGQIGLSRNKTRKISNLFRFAFRRVSRRLSQIQPPAERVQLLIQQACELMEKGFRSVALIDYYLKHVDDEKQLRLLDRWLAEEILAIAFANGHRKKNFKRLSFGRLREMGLPSLVHRRRLLRHGHIRSSFFVMRLEKQVERQRRRLSPRPRTAQMAGFPPGLKAAANHGS